MYMSFSCWSVSSSGEGGVFLFINPDLQQALVRWMEKRIKFFPYADPKPLGKDDEAPFSSILCSWDRHETWVPVSRDDGPLGGRAPENQPCAHSGAFSLWLVGWSAPRRPEKSPEVTAPTSLTQSILAVSWPCTVLGQTKLLSIFHCGLKNPDILVKEGTDLV